MDEYTLEESLLADTVMGALDEMAREYDHYEYGLPIASEWRDRARAEVCRLVREAKFYLRELPDPEW